MPDTTSCQDSDAEARHADQCDETAGRYDHHVIGVDVVFVGLVHIILGQKDASGKNQQQPQNQDDAAAENDSIRSLRLGAKEKRSPEDSISGGGRRLLPHDVNAEITYTQTDDV